MKNEIVQVVGSMIAFPIVVFTLAMCVYFFFGFLAWISTDPLDMFEDGPLLNADYSYSEAERRWDDCAFSTKQIYDDFNDTVGATYALEDKPSNDVQDFMRLCLEKNI